MPDKSTADRPLQTVPRGMPNGDVHPVAAFFPMLPDDELQALAEDIRANGLMHPIVLNAAGVLLDGRNRLSACKLAGVEPHAIVLPEETDEVAFIISANVARRHLTKGQCAMAIARAQTFSSGKFQHKGEVAHAAGLSGAHLSRAITVSEHAPDLVDLVLSGKVSLNDAYDVARERKTPVGDATDAPLLAVVDLETGEVVPNDVAKEAHRMAGQIVSEAFRTKSLGQSRIEAEHRAAIRVIRVGQAKMAVKDLLAVPAEEMAEDWLLDGRNGDLGDMLMQVAGDLRRYADAVTQATPQRLRAVK